jgi:APA family basic amino acid/polyamine antiporter
MWGYADVGADLYLALGLVLAATQGAAWLAFALAGFVYVLVGFAYTELASAYPVAGGGQYYALRGLGDFWGFLAGAALLLDYTVDVALFSVAAIGYLGWFVPHTAEPAAFGALVMNDPRSTAYALGLIALLTVLNLRGLRSASLGPRIIGAIDLGFEWLLVVFGFVFAWKPQLLVDQWHEAMRNLSLHDFAYGSSLAIISFVGLESISQAAEETRRPATIIPRTSLTLIFTVFLFAVALSILGLGVLPWQDFRDHKAAPIAHLASSMPLIGSIVGPIAAALGVVILSLSASAGLASAARLTASMSRLRMAPSWFDRRDQKRSVPRGGVMIFALLGGLEVVWAGFTPAPLENLANLYAFGASLAYILVVGSLIRLRWKDRFSPRPYKMPINFNIKRSDGSTVSVPVLAFVGLLGVVIIFLQVLGTHHIARIAGPAWVGGCLIAYLVYRSRKKLPVLGSVPRDWQREQIAVLTGAEEFDLLEQYKNAIEAEKKAAS